MNTTHARTLAAVALTSIALLSGCAVRVPSTSSAAAPALVDPAAVSGTLRWQGFADDQPLALGRPSVSRDATGTLVTASARIDDCSSSVMLFLDAASAVEGDHDLGPERWLVYERQCGDDVVAWAAQSGQISIGADGEVVVRALLAGAHPRSASPGSLTLSAAGVIAPPPEHVASPRTAALLLP